MSRKKYLKKDGSVSEYNIYYQIRELSQVNGFKLMPKHKLVLFVLESHGKKRKNPSRATLARECACSIPTLDSSIRDLVNIQLIDKKRVINGSNYYFLNEDLIIKQANYEIELRKSLKEKSSFPENFNPWDVEKGENK